MTIDFNTNFKDFLSTSQVYKNLVHYLHQDDSYQNGSDTTKRDFNISLQATVECMVIHHHLPNNIHYSRTDIAQLVSAQNSKQVRAAFKKHMHAPSYIRPFTYLYFTQENKELTHLRDEITHYDNVPYVAIDFNNNFKDFLEYSTAYNIVINEVLKDADIKSADEEQRKNYIALTYAALETILINWDVRHTPSFFNSTLAEMMCEQNSPHVRGFMKKNQKKLYHDANFLKSLVQLILSRRYNNITLEEMVVSEVEHHKNMLSVA